MQGFIAPGHVCTVMGYRQYEEMVEKFHVPIVVGGFEPVDLLEAILMLVRQLEAGQAVMENQYVRSVIREGNLPAQQIVETVFEVCDEKCAGLHDTRERTADTPGVLRARRGENIRHVRDQVEEPPNASV